MTNNLSNDDYADRMREQRGEPRLIRVPVMTKGEQYAEFIEQWEALMLGAGPWRKPTVGGIKKSVEAMPGVVSAEVVETSPGVVEVSMRLSDLVIFSKTINIPLSLVSDS